jgi:transposase
MRVPAAGEDGKFVVFGARDYASGQVVWQVSPRKDGKACVAFLDHLTATFPEGPLVVVLDNVGYHKGRLAKDWWIAQHDRVRPLWLPAYAPELNVIERLWRHLKDNLSGHRWWADQRQRWRRPQRTCSPISKLGSTTPIQTASPSSTTFVKLLSGSSGKFRLPPGGARSRWDGRGNGACGRPT